MAMTFEEFHATRVYYPDLRKLPTWQAANDWTPEPPAGYVYVGQLYIEVVTSSWNVPPSHKSGYYCLILGSQKYIISDLVVLELLLWDYARAEGLA